MPTNTMTKAEKAAIKRRQRARYKSGEPTEKEKIENVDLLQEIINDDKSDPKVKAIARLTKRNLGAPSKLRPAVASRIVRYILEGNHPRTACAAAGVAHPTLRKWEKRAKASLELAEELQAKKLQLAIAAEAEAAEADSDFVDAEADEDIEDADSADEDAESRGELSARAVEMSSDEIRSASLMSFVPEPDRIYVQLSEAISIATARSEMKLLRRAASGERGWQAAMTILERRFPKTWAKNETQRHIVEGDADKPVVVTYESDLERQARVARILQRAGAVNNEIIDGMAEEIESGSDSANSDSAS